jgi:hypothetical protein
MIHVIMNPIALILDVLLREILSAKIASVNEAGAASIEIGFFPEN